ncbi:MAG: ferrous iron transporter B [Gemmatimonadetes bacterium]|nr:ferrous iron transporter B [Gemmatimonadota bacterium]
MTVEKHKGTVELGGGRRVELVDLPGMRALSARSLDERVTLDVLHGRMEGTAKPDAIVLVVDTTRAETDLMLLDPLLEFGLPTFVVLNMFDELEARGGTLDPELFSARTGVGACRSVARSGVGMDELLGFLLSVKPRGEERGHPLIGAGSPPGRRLPTVDDLVARRGQLQRLLARSGHRAPGPSRWTRRLDAIFLHRLAGPAVFLAVAALVFQAIFAWAAPLMDLVDRAVGASGAWLDSSLPESWFSSLLVDGVWAGVGAVVIFLPQILVLFLFLGVLEDSGYLARAATIADRLMYRIGLQGRAFLPLLSGYACAIPAILSARTVENEDDRLATIFVTPFMTCSARLPVYALLIAAFIPAGPLLGPFFGTQAATLLALYLLGIFAAVGTAFLLRRTLLRAPRAAFILELPPYRWPTVRSIGLRLLDRSRIFLGRAGKMILTVSVVLWGLSQFPRVDGEPPPFEESALASTGRVIEPLIEPLGYDWQVGVGIISSLAAREVIVGTLGVIYGVGDDADESSEGLLDALQAQLEPAAAMGLLLFFAFALQCMSTVAVMRRETGGWKWPALQFAYMLALGWVGAFLAYRLL